MRDNDRTCYKPAGAHQRSAPRYLRAAWAPAETGVRECWRGPPTNVGMHILLMATCYVTMIITMCYVTMIISRFDSPRAPVCAHCYAYTVDDVSCYIVCSCHPSPRMLTWTPDARYYIYIIYYVSYWYYYDCVFVSSFASPRWLPAAPRGRGGGVLPCVRLDGEGKGGKAAPAPPPGPPGRPLSRCTPRRRRGAGPCGSRRRCGTRCSGPRSDRPRPRRCSPPGWPAASRSRP